MTNPIALCRVYGCRGDIHVRRVELAEPVPNLRANAAECVPIGAIMSREVVCARPELPAHELCHLMVRDHIGCLPVVDEHDRPIGMVTKFDLVEQLEHASRGVNPLASQTCEQVMMPLALTLGERATVAHAAMMMELEGLHHVPIVSDTGTLVGIVSSKDIVRWVAGRSEL